MSEKDKKGILAPSYEALIDKATKAQYLMVEEVANGDTLSVVTMNHRYDFVVLASAKRHVRITSDHPALRGPFDGYVLGSLLSAGGSSLLMGRVALGLCLAFSSPVLVKRFSSPEIRTSPVQEILLNGQRVLPGIDA